MPFRCESNYHPQQLPRIKTQLFPYMWIFFSSTINTDHTLLNFGICHIFKLHSCHTCWKTGTINHNTMTHPLLSVMMHFKTLFVGPSLFSLHRSSSPFTKSASGSIKIMLNAMRFSTLAEISSASVNLQEADLHVICVRAF